MSRIKLVLPAILLVALAMSTAAYSAPAGGGAAVSIQIHPEGFADPQVGTWTATGGINDSGRYERTGGHTTGSIPDWFCGFEHTGAFKEEFLLTSSKGTLTVTAEHLQTADGTYYGKTTGVWQIKSGTGDYSRVSGHGTDEFLPQTLTLSLTGVVFKSS